MNIAEFLKKLSRYNNTTIARSRRDSFAISSKNFLNWRKKFPLSISISKVKIRVKNAFCAYFFNLKMFRKIVSLLLKFRNIYLFTCQNLKLYFSANFVKI